jgi:hypothetical protein
MTFKRAKCIELHEAQTVITLSEEGYAFTSPTARNEQASRLALQLRFSDIFGLAQLLGLNPQKGTPALLDQIENQDDIEDMTLPVLRTYYEVPADEPGVRIINLECEVQGPNLVDIRVETHAESSPPEAANEVETITYSGTFTIWWASERNTSPEVLLAQAEAHPMIPVGTELLEVTGNGEEKIDLNIDDLDEVAP